METDPIIVRIQCIDEATTKINAIASSIRNLEVKMPEMNLGGSYKQVNVIKRNLESALIPLKNLERETMNFQRQLGMMNVEPIERLDETLQIAGMSQKQFTSFLQRNNMEVIKGVGVYDRLTGAVISQGQATKLAVIYSRRFKMEWLSIMFAGMALDRIFGSIINSQLQLWGVTEGLSSMWTVLMAPAMEIITEKIWDIINAVMELPEETKLVIGFTVLGFDILGKVMSVLGQIFLGVMGLKLLFPSLGPALSGGIMPVLGKIGTAILGLGAPFLIVAGIIIAVIVGMYLAWKTNFLNMKQTVQNFIDAVKQFFGGIIKFFSGILDVIVGLFTGDFEKVKEGIKKIFTGLFDWLVGGFKAAFNLIVGVIKGALMIVYNIIKVLIDSVIWLINAIGKVAGRKTNIIDFKMPTFQKGGIMPYTGVAYLHEGERIIPKNQVKSEAPVIYFSPSVNLNANVNSDMDIRSLADKLNYYWAKDFERMTKGRVS